MIGRISMAKLRVLTCLVACVALGAPSGLGEEARKGRQLSFTEVLAIGLVVEKADSVISGIVRKSPAERAGLRVGDRILKAEGKILRTSYEQTMTAILLRARKAGHDAVSLGFRVARGKVEQTIEVPITLREIDVSVVVNRGLDFLALELERDPEYKKTPQRSFYAPIIYAPLTGLAFLANGSTRVEGRHAAGIRRALAYVMKHGGRRKEKQDEINRSVGGNLCSLTHNAGFSAMFLAQFIDSEFPRGAGGRERSSRGAGIELRFSEKQIRAKLSECGKTLATLCLPNGGWQHGSGGANMLGYTHLTAATITAMNGLLMARQVGVKVDRSVLTRGFGYLRKVTMNGHVGYAVGNRGSFSAGRNAGLLQCLHRGGSDRNISTAPVLATLLKNLDKASTGHGSPTWHLFHASLALANLEPTGFEQFFSLYGRRLLGGQQGDGSVRAMDPPGVPPGKGEDNRVWGALYTTPLIALALLAPYRQDLLVYDFNNE
jgi:PDZ domain/Family of unknown function (DUF6288)